jgi:hypothetical protein
MVDLNTWEALRGAGLDTEAAVAAASDMLASRMAPKLSA